MVRIRIGVAWSLALDQTHLSMLMGEAFDGGMGTGDHRTFAAASLRYIATVQPEVGRRCVTVHAMLAFAPYSFDSSVPDYLENLLPSLTARMIPRILLSRLMWMSRCTRHVSCTTCSRHCNYMIIMILRSRWCLQPLAYRLDRGSFRT